MTRDDIIRMAREAGLPLAWISESGVLTLSELERFAALVAAHEREECARVSEDVASRDYDYLATDCAAAIRARGEK